jgi:hypothetical protein
MTVRLDPVAWQSGYDTGYTVAPDAPMPPTPSGDCLAWASGFVEGRAARIRAASNTSKCQAFSNQRRAES